MGKWSQPTGDGEVRSKPEQRKEVEDSTSRKHSKDDKRDDRDQDGKDNK